jgi:hypothetical protein
MEARNAIGSGLINGEYMPIRGDNWDVKVDK